MQRRGMVLGLAAAIPVAATAQVRPYSTAPAALAKQVRRLVADYADAWNAGDMAAMGRLYTPNVHWVNVVGMHWHGFDEVDYAHRKLFEQSFSGVRQTLEEIESIAPLPGGGAVAVARWSVGEYRTPAGAVVAPSRTRMTLVLVPAQDRLLIAHGTNIQIVEPAQASDPVRRRREAGVTDPR